MGKKELRRKAILKTVLYSGYIPKSAVLATQFGVSERTIRSDLAALADEIPKEAVKDIYRDLMLRIRARLPEMDDRNLIKHAEFFLSKKQYIEQKQQREELEIVIRDELQKECGEKITEMLGEYAEIGETPEEKTT